MLAPDVVRSESSMQSGINAAQAVTQNSQAVITLVPAYYAALAGKWASLRPTLQGVVDDAKTWTKSLCAPYTSGVPNLFISFNSTFQASAQTLLDQVQTLKTDPNDAAAKDELVSGLQSLLGQLEQLQSPMNGLQEQLIAFETTLQNDWTTINGVIEDLSHNVPGAGTLIESISATLSVSFYSSNMLSPCVAIVMINASVSVQLKAALSTQPEVVPVVLEQSLLNTLRTQNQDATAAMSNILNEWTTLMGKYRAVITDLENAEGAPSAILAELYIETAQVAWAQLASFAHALAPSR